MLKDHFYYIAAAQHQENIISVSLKLNNEHEIFAGHFPGQPVVPGVCMLQMVKEVLSDALSLPYQLKKAGNLKFLAPVDPRLTDDLQLKLTYKSAESDLQVTATMSANEVVCFKMQGVFAVL